MTLKVFDDCILFTNEDAVNGYFFYTYLFAEDPDFQSQINWSSHLDPLFSNNLERDSALSWQVKQNYWSSPINYMKPCKSAIHEPQIQLSILSEMTQSRYQSYTGLVLFNFTFTTRLGLSFISQLPYFGLFISQFT